MNRPGRYFIIVGSMFVIMCIVFYLVSLDYSDMPDNDPAPTTSPTPTVTITQKPSPAPTVTVTQSAQPMNSSCLETGNLARDMQAQIVILSSLYGEQSQEMDKAIRALAQKNWTALNKSLAELRDTDEASDEPMLKLQDLSQRLDLAYRECENS